MVDRPATCAAVARRVSGWMCRTESATVLARLAAGRGAEASVFNRPAGIAASVAANASGLRRVVQMAASNIPSR